MATEGLLVHGAAELPSVVVDTYNAELRHAEGFLGDRASNRAFVEILTDWRERVEKTDEDPLEGEPDKPNKRTMEALLKSGDIEAAGVIHGAIEEFAQEFALVIRRFLRSKSWKGTERIVVGGGFRESRVGELAIGRTMVLLKADRIAIDLVPIRHHPDEAGLIGAAHLAPGWIFAGHEAILAVDIGGSNIRAGVVQLRHAKAADLSKAGVARSLLWRHADEMPTREQAVERLVGMLEELIARAKKEGWKLAPFIGIGCPGLIRADGSIESGGQNLPGNWEAKNFNLPQRLAEAIGEIDGHRAEIVMHNDAVVQGLSEVPFMQDVQHWGVMTVGTGLGNARFTNRNGPEPKRAKKKPAKKG